MAKFFKTPKSLSEWIRSQDSAQEAFEILVDMIDLSESPRKNKEHELDLKETCESIYNDNEKNASDALFILLSEYNLTELNDEVNMKKSAQVSRQRNDWVVGERNKWNRSVDGFDANTPWRVSRDKFYDFTHYHTDAIKFDENPNRVYSGEAIWRMYVMDKFYREYKTPEGKWAGGYINDRFHVFPTAGTPSNPDVPRDGGNQMGLGINERTRKPRPHQYSTERRLEEARGNKTEDLEFTTVAKSFNRFTKTSGKVPVERKTDRIYNMFCDVIDMKEAGLKYDDILEKVANHYDASITGVAQIMKFADKMIKKHEGIAYEFNVFASMGGTYTIHNEVEAQLQDGSAIVLIPGTELATSDNFTFEIINGENAGKIVTNLNAPIQNVSSRNDIHDGAEEVGLI